MPVSRANYFWITSALLVKGVIFQQVFDSLPQDREVNPGELISIPCRVRNRIGECAWLKDGVVVGKIPDKYAFDREPTNGDCGIVITNTQLEDDDGLWQCQVTQASLQEGTLTSPEVKLTVREAPFPPFMDGDDLLELRGEPMTVQAGDRKQLNCTARKGNPPAVFKWLLDEKEIKSNINQTNVPDPKKRKTWIAISVIDFAFEKSNNNKILKCVALHDAYETRSKEVGVRLNVVYSPVIRLEGGPRGKETIVEGTTVVLKCLVDANPRAKVIWRKAGYPGIYDMMDQIEFNPVNRNHSGIFSCSAKNDIGQSEEVEMALDVKYKPKIMRTYPYSRTTVNLHQTTKLICEAEGNPPPRYSWLQRIGGDPVIWQERAADATFFIHNVSYAFQGIYLCQASNVINGFLNTYKSEEICLDVTGPPEVIFDFPMSTIQHLTVDSEETAVIRVTFCADPEPKTAYWRLDVDTRLEVNSKTSRFTAEELEPVPMRADCYEARLILVEAKSSDSKTYSLVMENDIGKERFDVYLEVREPLDIILIAGVGAAIISFLIFLVCLLLCLAKKGKCCFKSSDEFTPGSQSIVENCCVSDMEKSNIAMAKSDVFANNESKSLPISTIAEGPYYPNSRKADRNDNKEMLLGSSEGGRLHSNLQSLNSSTSRKPTRTQQHISLYNCPPSTNCDV